MKVARTIAEVRRLTAGRRNAGAIGFVPTMGALHDGHISLLRRAREECETVVLSVFVNPLQFGPREDLANYPRPEEDDLKIARREGVDIAFVPAVDEMYPPGHTTTIHVADVSASFEGASRPGHFDGVATVVAKLFNIVQPDRAYFGQKDAQQVAVVKRMVRDLSMPVEIVVCPTVRAEDGLALSSRNAYLSDEARAAAVTLWHALEAGRDVWLEDGSAAEAVTEMVSVLSSHDLVDADYAAVVDPDSFEGPRTDRALLIVAARVDGTRLIDNLLVER